MKPGFVQAKTMRLVGTSGLVFVFALSSAALAEQRVSRQASSGSPIVVEAESLAGSAQVTHGKAVPQDMRPFGAGWGGDAQLFWSPAQIGAELRLAFSITTTGRYEIFLHFTRAPDYAFARASFDGAPSVAFNGYATTVSRDRALLAMRDLTPGIYEVLIKVAMKDGSAKGLNVGLDRIEFAPVGAPVAESAAAVPVLRLDSDADQLSAAMRGIEPLSTAARLSVVQRAMSLPISSAGEPLRLTASSPRVFQRADLKLANGLFSADVSDDGWIGLSANGRVTLSYFGVEAQQPHLLDCGVKLDMPADIRILPHTKSAKGMHPLQGASTQSFAAGDQRLLAVFVPGKTSFSVLIEPATGTPFSIKYCELTPFK
jgi:hypothetical protein